MMIVSGKPAFIKKADIIIIILLIFLSFLFYFLLSKNRTSDSATVFVDGEIYMKISLLQNKEYEIDLTGYHYIISVNNRKIAVISADCPDKICEKTGYIENPGEVIVCLPAKLVIKINGITKTDAITY